MNLKNIFVVFYFIICISSAEFQRFPREFDSLNSNRDAESEFFHSAANTILNNLGWLQHELIPDALAQSNISSQCNTDFTLYTDALWLPRDPGPPGTLAKWAYKMADSTGKFESGILDGNAVFEGRYLQCIDATKGVENPPIKPLYCYATWITYFFPLDAYTYIRGLGYCIPESCTDDDAAILLETVYTPWIPTYTGVAVKCERDSDWDIGSDAEAIISIVILCLFGVLVLVASLFDAFRSYTTEPNDADIQVLAYTSKPGGQDNKAYTEHVYHVDTGMAPPPHVIAGNTNNNNDQRSDTVSEVPLSVIQPKHAAINVDTAHETEKQSPSTQDQDLHMGGAEPGLALKLLLCFSLYENLPLVVSAKQPRGGYACLNGLRVIAMMCVVLGHTYSSGYIVFDNWKVLVDAAQKTGFQKISTMDVYVDTFFILSAFLVTISFLKKLKRCEGKLKPADVALHYFNRYWRLTPVYMLVLMVYTNLLHYMIPQGPFMIEYVEDVDSCSTEWWKNMLYINTFFAENGQMCMGVSWYLCVDMQLFVIAPLFLYLLYRWEKFGIGAVIAAFCGGIVANIVLWEKYYTQTEEEPVDIMWDIYTMPWTRCPVYFMGMLLGFYFYKTEGKVKIPKVVVAVGWLIAFSMFFMTAYVPILDDCLHVSALYDCAWSVAGKVTWSTLYRPMWGIWVCWVIIVCQAGYGGIINSFLSWNFFVPLGRLTYLCYLIHFIVIYVYYYGSAVQPYFTHFYMVFAFFGILVTTYMSALVAGAAISAPLMRIAAVFLPSRKDKGVR